MSEHVQLQPLDYAVMAGYMLALVALGLVLRRRAGGDMESYFLAGRKLPGWADDVIGSLEFATALFERESGRSYPAPLVLCGAGRLGQITLRGLRRAGVPVIAFADNNTRLHGQQVDGCKRDRTRWKGRGCGRDVEHALVPVRRQQWHGVFSAVE